MQRHECRVMYIGIVATNDAVSLHLRVAVVSGMKVLKFMAYKSVLSCRMPCRALLFFGVDSEKLLLISVVLRLSPCSECSLYSSGNFPGV